MARMTKNIIDTLKDLIATNDENLIKVHQYYSYDRNGFRNEEPLGKLIYNCFSDYNKGVWKDLDKASYQVLQYLPENNSNLYEITLQTKNPYDKSLHVRVWIVEIKSGYFY